MSTQVAVVVVTYNSSDVIDGLLDSVPAAMGNLTHQVVVVDNGSCDDTVAKVQRRDDAMLVQQANHGYSAGINAGVRMLPASEEILILNPDVLLLPDSMLELTLSLRRNGAGIAAPRMLDAADGQLAFSLRRSPTLLRASGLSFTRIPALDECVCSVAEYQVPHVVDWAVGAALLVSRRCFDDLGGWDESFFLYSEETDFCLRAADRGWPTFYEPRAVVSHIGGASGRTAQTHTMQILNRVRLYSRRHGLPAAWTYFGLISLGQAKRSLRGESESRAALRALLFPHERPRKLGLRPSLLPR